ncbi:MAG: serine/threonine protein kinase [Chloracidobacterium sp.]|nr:serine/threonine protein kinase [Chloracidobacterium sp.]
MYCPKCKESFEEGSRRFCPTDGARLISDTPFAAGRRAGSGIFSNLISKTEVSRDLDESFSNVPQFVITEEEPSMPFADTGDISGDFFEFKEFEPDPILETVIEDPVVELPTAVVEQSIEQPIAEQPKEEIKPAEIRPAARKIKPYEIPAGHVELGKKHQPTIRQMDFDAEEPQKFVGKTVKGRYIVTEFLGGEEESFAFLADDKLSADKLVLVRLLLGEDADEVSGNILDDEIVALSHISHPNIARLIDSGRFTDGTRFLISEYIDALSVNDVLSIHGHMDGLRTARIIRQVANALSEAHQEGVIHRDLRPENIIVTPGDNESEQAILVNFEASSGEPNDFNLGYKAPEVFGGRADTISSDIYSLGVVAFEMLTGIMPFEAKTARAMVRAQYAGLERNATEVRPELPLDVDRVFEKALAFDVADRFVKARDFGEALYAAFAETEKNNVGVPLEATTNADAPALPASEEPAWKNRSPEPPQVGNTRSKLIAGVGILLLLILLPIGWYYLVKNPVEPNFGSKVPSNNLSENQSPISAVSETEMPPLPRNIPQPPNTNFYQNSKQNLKGDLIRNFVGFTMYYPKEWKVNGPQESSTASGRGKFLDISRLTPEGKLKEQMLVSYYPSKGTFKEDADKYPQMVKETSETLKKLLPGYQVVSEGEIKLNGDWRAYEVKFQGGGTSENGEKLIVWGRRLFIPAARPGVRSGFEITMLATSLADEVKSVDDVGVRGELASVLYSFEPSQNF